MVTLIALFSTLAATLSLSSAAPSKRQTPDTCSSFANAALAVRPKGTNDSPTWVGVVQGVTHAGIDGQPASILVTKDDNGKPLAPQIWEFAHCTKFDNRSPPAGYKPPSEGRPVAYYGIVRPWNATKHCLAVESTEDDHEGDRNSILDSRCTDIPEEYRTWFFHSIAASDAPRYLEFADQNMTIVIGGTEHAELQFFTEEERPGQTEMELVLIAPPKSS